MPPIDDVDHEMIELLLGDGATTAAFNRSGLGHVIVSAYLSGRARQGGSSARRSAGNPYHHGYDPDEPRDWHGRWTTGGAQRPDQFVRGLYGGRIYRIGGGPGSGAGDNLPPEDAEEIPGPEPFPGAPKVPQGWDVPARIIGGLEYPATRRPVLDDGTPWPVATVDQIKAILAPRKGATPMTEIFIPDDGVGSILIGTIGTDELPKPNGYDAVMLIGTPQVISPQGVENGHAEDGIVEALRLAGTHQFSTIYFNRSFSTVTKGIVQSLIRPDVTAVARPPFDDPHLYRPYESYSQGQIPIQRQRQMPNVPGIAPVDGRDPSQWKKSHDR